MYRWFWGSLILCWCWVSIGNLPSLAQSPPTPSPNPTPDVKAPIAPKVITIQPDDVLRVGVPRLSATEKFAVFLGELDLTSQIEREGQDLVYRSQLLPLPIGEQTLTVYRVDSPDRWETLTTVLVKVERSPDTATSTPKPSPTPSTPDSQLPTPSTPDSEGPTPTPSSPPSEAPPAATNTFTFTPKINLNLKSQILENRTLDARATGAKAFDLAFTSELVGGYENKEGKWRGSATLIGSTIQNEALRFGQIQDRAPQIDLSKYLLDFTDGNNSLSLGHTCFGNHPFLLASTCTRGFSGKMQLNSFADLSFGRISTSEVVGFDNILGIDRVENTLTAANLGLQLAQNSAGGVRLETTAFNGSRLPNAGFNVGEVVDAEESDGIGWRLTANDDSGRWKADAGFARSTFVSRGANDPELTEGLNIVPLQPATRNAWYAETNYELIKDFKFDATRNLSLAANLRLEKIDPQFGTLGATLDADRIQAQYGLNATIAGANLQFQQTNFEDNINNIPNLLKTNSKNTVIGVNVPLQDFLQIKNPFLPTIAYNYEHTKQLGSIANALVGGFNNSSQIPDQSNITQRISANWQISDFSLSYKFSDAVQDNRQIGRENADFRNLNHQVSVTWQANPELQLNLGYNFTNARSIEQQITRFTNSPTFGVSWQFIPSLTFAFNYNVNDETDTLGQAFRSDNSLELLLTWSFLSNTFGRETPGSVFLRYGRQSAINRSTVENINSDATISIVNAGMTWSF
jgi:hypothetical protein